MEIIKSNQVFSISKYKHPNKLAPDEQWFGGQSLGWHELILQPSDPAASNFPLPAFSKYV